jgi:hypothetical protein
MLIDDDSETLSGQPLGACRREWQALSKARNNADGRLASCPEGGPLRPESCVAMLDKGAPLPAHRALTPGLSGPLSSSISMRHHTSVVSHIQLQRDGSRYSDKRFSQPKGAQEHRQHNTAERPACIKPLCVYHWAVA